MSKNPTSFEISSTPLFTRFEWASEFLRSTFLGLSSLFVLTDWVSAQAVPNKEGRDERIGVCTHFSQNWSVAQIMPLIAKSGAAWIRDDLNWADMEPTPGNYQIPPKAKGWIQAAREMGLKIDLILAYGNPAYPDHYDTVAYAKAAGWLAREVAKDVQAIEILNEPNNFGFRTTYGGAWNGNEPKGAVSPYLRKYVELLNAASKEIKLANPQMLVIGLGTPPPASFRMIALGLSPEVDGLTDHPYSGKLPEQILYPGTPDIIQRDGITTADADGTLASQVSMFRAQAKKWGTTEKLWHTEWGYATTPPTASKPGTSEKKQAIYIARRLLESEAIGVEHTFVYDFQDSGSETFGLIKGDRSPKISYLALQRVSGRLTGIQPSLPDQQASMVNVPAVEKEGLGNRCYTFSSSDGQKSVVAFWEAKPWEENSGAKSAVITLPLAHGPRAVFLFDPLSGKQIETAVRSLEDNRVSVTVSVSGAPQLLIIQ
jgi:hypothetical protein